MAGGQRGSNNKPQYINSSIPYKCTVYNTKRLSQINRHALCLSKNPAFKSSDSKHAQLIPDWEPTFKMKLSTINAKSETVFKSPLYRDLVVRQRCIIPLSGFFEWKEDAGRKRPFKIHVKDEPIMSVGDLGSMASGTSDERCSFSILTTAANSFMSQSTTECR